MKNKRIIAIVIGVVLFAGVVGEHVFPSSPEHVSQQVKGEHKFSLINEALASPIKYPKKIEQAKRVKRFQDAMSSGFEYYGRVVDQHGDPVAGAKVTAEWAYFPFIPNGDFGPNYKTLHFITDSDGRFFIQKDDGMSIAIDAIEKKGYQIKSKKFYMFSDGGYKMLQSFSDPEKPVIFHAWKKTEAEPLVYNKERINFDPSGKVYAVDLFHWVRGIKGKVRDIKMSCKRPIDAQIGKSFDWEVAIEGIGGGIIETTDLFMNEAPKSGYEPEWKLVMDKADSNWRSEVSKKFYLKSRNGDVYGRMELTIIPLYNKNCRVNAEWWLNPNGSRNLQYDRSKRIQ
jgi:hypothetical protein